MSRGATRSEEGSFRFFVEAIFLLLYEVASTTSQYIPPLIGICFAYLVLEYHERTRAMQNLGISWYAAVFFLIFAEQIHGFYVFSSLIAFIVFYSIFFNWLFVSLKWRSGLLFIFITAGYVLSWAISSFFSYTQSEHVLSFGVEYLVYIVLEGILALVFLKERMI